MTCVFLRNYLKKFGYFGFYTYAFNFEFNCPFSILVLLARLSKQLQIFCLIALQQIGSLGDICILSEKAAKVFHSKGLKGLNGYIANSPLQDFWRFSPTMYAYLLKPTLPPHTHILKELMANRISNEIFFHQKMKNISQNIKESLNQMKKSISYPLVHEAVFDEDRYTLQEEASRTQEKCSNSTKLNHMQIIVTMLTIYESNDENTDQNKNTYSQQGYQKNKCSEEETRIEENNQYSTKINKKSRSFKKFKWMLH
ncbi:hypothetical protein U3516DRAFT_735287 [Neocallimastix sp. 'constans']